MRDTQGSFLHNSSCQTQRNICIICGETVHVLFPKASCIYDKSMLARLTMHQICFVKCESLYFSESAKKKGMVLLHNIIFFFDVVRNIRDCVHHSFS